MTSSDTKYRVMVEGDDHVVFCYLNNLDYHELYEAIGKATLAYPDSANHIWYEEEEVWYEQV